jgi:GTPase SAR1 family protein
MLVFDVTNEQSFDNIRNWMTDINKHVEKATVQKILVGNKADAADTVRLQLISAQPAAATASASLAPTLFQQPPPTISLLLNLPVPRSLWVCSVRAGGSGGD